MLFDIDTLTAAEIAEKYDVEDGDVPGSKVYRLRKTPEMLRQEAYEAEADPLFREAQYYQAEAEGLRLLGDAAASAAANEKADELLKQYASKKVEIRERFPDPEPARYWLNATGTYHLEGCGSVSENSAAMTLDDIALANPSARPCSRCGPPALAVEEEAVV